MYRYMVFSNRAISPALTFEDYNPVSTLVVPQHKLTASRFPFIDVHNYKYASNRPHAITDIHNIIETKAAAFAPEVVADCISHAATERKVSL